MVTLNQRPYGYSKGKVFSVGVASAVCLVENLGRKMATFVNVSDTPITIFKGDVAILNAGIVLGASGGNYIESPDMDHYIWRGAFSCISSGALKDLAVTEDV